MRRIMTLVTVGAILCGGYISAASDVSPLRKFAWGENVGWLNFRDANSTTDGVEIHETFLAGYVWGENVGWIHLGDGTPGAGGVCRNYVNADDTDYGVNVDSSTGELSGFGWGENIGWVDFDGGALATPAQPASFDLAARRFRGYAWGEHVGWINLDDADHFAASFSPADFDKDGDVDGVDFSMFASCFNKAGNPPRSLGCP